MGEAFDFIIVGGGTSGCVLAHRLAESSSKPKVLLLEGGGPNHDDSIRTPDGRFSAFMNPELNWGYKSIPQPYAGDKEIDCPRGRGLGGSSAINFSCWLLGHKNDFNEWADIVGDDCWKWEGKGGVKERFRKIENVHAFLDNEQVNFVSRGAIDAHSKDGMVDLSFNKVWLELQSVTFQAAKEFGQPLNGDINSGDPTGFGVGPSTYYKGLRVTAATAYLSSPPSNLTILTDSLVSRVIFDELKTAIGVETLSGKIYHAAKEVILSAGAIDTPKILLLSGVGPKVELAECVIPIVHDLPGVGRHLIDHCRFTTTLLLKPRTGIDTQEIASIAAEPLTNVGPQFPMAWLSSSAVKSSKEFLSLPKKTQTFLQKVPSYEFMTTSLPFGLSDPELLSPTDKIITFVGGVMNAQSTGSIKLASNNPSGPPLIDLNYVSHPFDRRVAIEALRALVKYSSMPSFAAITERRIEGPESDSDEDLFDHVKKSIGPIFHFGGTCKMGRVEDSSAVVNKDFKVNGVKRLRVVDHSVAPLMANNHVQSTCYLIGETAAEKIIAEYGLST